MGDVSYQPLSGALTDPCPVCTLRPVKGVRLHGQDAMPTEGAYTICFGCGLVQVVHGGMYCALTEAEADWVFEQPRMIANLLAVMRMRAQNPLRTAEMVRDRNDSD